MSIRQGRLTTWLQDAPGTVFTLYAIAASFATYFCMYAFRKSFAAASFENQTFGAIDLKTAMVISQIIGYTISKYVAIKICSEITRARRAMTLVGLIVAAELALLLFAVLPPGLKIVAIFLNGLPLGMVWGMVVLYLEGRQTSELLLAGLSCSFILASGMVKDVGRALMSDFGVTEAWMPVATGACFLPAFLVAVWMLNQLPQPSETDARARSQREPMSRELRRAFIRRFLLGLVLLFVAYFFLTAYRDFRDNYGVEIFNQLGYADEPAIFTKTELPVAFGVLAALAALNLIKDNRRGLIGAYGIMTAGVIMMGVGMQLYKDLFQSDVSRLAFFRGLTYAMSIGGAAFLMVSCVHFLHGIGLHRRTVEESARTTAAA